MSSSWSFGDLHTVSGLLANFFIFFFFFKEGTCVQMGGLRWLHNLVISWRHCSEVPGLGCGDGGSGLLSERNRLSRWQPCQEVGFFLGGDVPGKLICTEAGAYELHPKKVELVLFPVCSASCQSLRIAPRVHTD